jgi:menaquinone reductase, iron-sulfur cluster-binding subunit
MSAKRYGMAIDLDKCNGCGACMMACAVENNVPPAPQGANDRKGITWVRVFQVSNGEDGPNRKSVFVPVLCQQCGEEAPCVSVCPQQAVQVDPATGIVGQMPERCLGCRYCMAACPYHARSFNWWDPDWPGRLSETLSPDVSTRTRGVVEKCSFCSHRLQAAQEAQAAAGEEAKPPEYTPACAEACPTGAIVFGNLDDPESAVSRAAQAPGAFRLLERLGTGAKVYYRSEREWVRRLADGRAAGDGGNHAG